MQMNVFPSPCPKSISTLLTTVTLTPTAPTIRARSTAPVIRDTLEMESFAQVVRVKSGNLCLSFVSPSALLADRQTCILPRSIFWYKGYICCALKPRSFLAHKHKRRSRASRTRAKIEMKLNASKDRDEAEHEQRSRRSRTRAKIETKPNASEDRDEAEHERRSRWSRTRAKIETKPNASVSPLRPHARLWARKYLGSRVHLVSPRNQRRVS